jgi:hypothetical protein
MLQRRQATQSHDCNADVAGFVSTLLCTESRSTGVRSSLVCKLVSGHASGQWPSQRVLWYVTWVISFIQAVFMLVFPCQSPSRQQLCGHDIHSKRFTW